MNWVAETLQARQVPAEWAALVATGAALGLLLALAWAANFLAKRVILRGVAAVVRRTSFQWDNEMLEAGVFTRLSHLVPAVIVKVFGPGVFGERAEVLAGVNAAVAIYIVFICIAVFFALLDALHQMAERGQKTVRMPVKGFVQAVKLIATLVGLVLGLSIVLDKTPLYLLSGVGALTAVLLLVFRDAILGFVAGIMISVNELVRVGDWIEMPKAGADGDVIDVSLTTVKVRNWDKTITSIPTYSLISDSFKNWRGMQEMGGRRIKRAIPIEVQTIRFADEAMVARWRKIGLLRHYLEAKQAQVTAYNAKEGVDLSILGNGRRLTNLGTFRAYCAAYLRAHPKIHRDMTFLVRQLAPTAQGLPLEIYVFTTDTRWAFYEDIQSDIFDHLLAVIGEFDLRVFQQPSGRDVHDVVTRFAGGRRGECGGSGVERADAPGRHGALRRRSGFETRKSAERRMRVGGSKRGGEDGGEFGGGEGERVRFHAAGAGGGFDDRGEIRGGDAVGGERRDAKGGEEVVGPADEVRGGGVRLGGDETCDFVVAGERRVVGCAGVERGEVGLNHMWQECGADGAVGRDPHAADGAGETVDGAEAGVGEGESAEEAGERQVFAGNGVAGVFHGAAERAGGAADAFDAEGVGERVRARGNVGLDELSEGVEAGGGGECGWEVVSEFGVNHREARQHMGAAEGDLYAMRG